MPASPNRRSHRQTPQWAWRDQRIKSLYEVAARFGLTVDHVIPLQGKTVSGLHVFENLQLLPLHENQQKRNNFSGSEA